MEIDQILTHKAGMVEAYLLKYFNSFNLEERYPRNLIEASKYSLFSNGKRFRPVLALLVNDLFDSDPELVMPFAAAVELIHTYSLIHDDLPAMDDDDLRRGLPTCHVKYGESTAILAGDALLTEVMSLISLLDINADALKKVLRKLAVCSGFFGMVAGQTADLMAEKKSPDAQDLDFIHRHKTGALIEASVVIPGIINSAADLQIDALSLYGRNLGLAFQIADDILDVEGDEQILGKPIGSDEGLDKTTYVSLYGLEKAKKIAAEKIKEAKESLDIFPKNTLQLKMLADFCVSRQK